MRLRMASLAVAIRSGNLLTSVSRTATSYRFFHSEFAWLACMAESVKGIVSRFPACAQFHESCKGGRFAAHAKFQQQMNRLSCVGVHFRRPERDVLSRTLRLLQANARRPIRQRRDLLLMQSFCTRPAVSQVSAIAGAS